MSADEALTEEDKALERYFDSQHQDTEADDETANLAAQRAAITSHDRPVERRLRDAEQQLDAQRDLIQQLVQSVNRLQDTVEGGRGPVGQTTLEKYSTMTPDDRREVLPRSEQRAVTIYEHWDDIAWKTGEAFDTPRRVIETGSVANVKHSPSKAKYRLEQVFDEELAWNEIYRALKAVAKLSGGEESVDDAGRTHITGGTFEYHVQRTGDNSDTRRVLERVEER